MDGFYSATVVEEQLANGESVWTALHPDLPGCNATGRDPSEALENLEKSAEAWLAVAQEVGLPVPPPRPYPSIMLQYLPRPGYVQETETTLDGETQEIAA